MGGMLTGEMDPPLRRLAAVGCVAALVLALAAPLARAAQDSTVISDNAPIRVEPKSGSKVLEYLPIGAEVRISSYPMPGGWYKMRSKTGAYGWIHETFLSAYKPAPEAPTEEAGPRPERDRKWFIRGIGGFDFFAPDDLNHLFGFTDLDIGTLLSGEAGVFLAERVALVFRAEAIFKDLTARENTSGVHFNVGIRSYPVMGGMDFFFWKLPALRLSLGIFGGVALATSFSSEATSLPAQNTVVLQRSPFTTLVRLNLTRPLGRILSVFIEAGYRYLRTEDIDTQSAQSIQGGTQVYGKDGVFKSRVIDLTGPILAVGLGVHF